MVPLLKIRGLSREFGAGRRRVRAISDIDLEVYTGETLGLVGESGCGKTTLARCALRLLEPSSGSVEFDGQNLLTLAPGVLRGKRREFQFIFQDALAALDPRMTVREILLEPYEAHALGSRREREGWVRNLMEAVALDGEFAGRRPAALSGGQQQRVGIARALALKPRLLIADEPVSALDASVQAQILNLLADLQKRFGLTLILISHSLAVVHYLCTRVAVMYLGRIVEEASAETFFREPRHPYSRLLLASMPGLDLERAATSVSPAGELPSPSNPPPGCTFHPRCPHVFDRCRALAPPMAAQQGSAKVACFLYT
jgi:peptide/nickel transport system ATP-binding protein